jgi:hypothetical protein
VPYTPTAATRSSIEIIKQFQWKGATRLWSNRYHFTGPLTLDAGEWTALADAIVAEEALALADVVAIVGAVGNDATTATSHNLNGDAVFTKTYSTDGVVGPSGVIHAPGEAVGLVRYTTDARSSKNHPIYLFNYYHGALRDSTGGYDKIDTTWQNALSEYANDWEAGFSDGTNTRVRCGPHGAVAQAHVVKDFLTHRDFPT